MKKLSKQNKIRFVIIVMFLIVTVAITILAVPLIRNLTSSEGRNKIVTVVKSLGPLGWLLFIILQVLQVVVALIPGEPIEILSGILFGTFGGLLLCLLGLLIGTVIVYYLIKLVGKPLLDVIIPEEKIKNLKFLQDQKKLESLVFILFFIPGTPKDVLTYFVPLTKIKPLHFFVIATLARIPSIVTSTIVGANLVAGNWKLSVLIFVITALIGLAGIWFNDKFTDKFNRKKKNTIDKKKNL